MKIFRNGFCYVDKSVFKSLPESMTLSKRRYGGREFALVSDPKGISYLRERKDIVDYDDISYLYGNALENRINQAFASLEPYSTRVLNSSEEELKKLYANKIFMTNLRSRENVYFTLLDYKNNKDEIDENIRVSICGGNPVKEATQKVRKQ